MISATKQCQILLLLSTKKNVADIANELNLSSKEVEDWLISMKKPLKIAIEQIDKLHPVKKKKSNLDKHLGKENKVAFISSATSEMGDSITRAGRKQDTSSYIRPINDE